MSAPRSSGVAGAGWQRASVAEFSLVRGRALRLAAVSAAALGIVWWLALDDDAPRSVVVALAVGWPLMPASLLIVARRPQWRNTPFGSGRPRDLRGGSHGVSEVPCHRMASAGERDCPGRGARRMALVRVASSSGDPEGRAHEPATPDADGDAHRAGCCGIAHRKSPEGVVAAAGRLAEFLSAPYNC